MSPTQSAAILKQHNLWRRWDGEIGATDAPESQNPRELGKAIDAAVAFIEQEMAKNHV